MFPPTTSKRRTNGIFLMLALLLVPTLTLPIHVPMHEVPVDGGRDAGEVMSRAGFLGRATSRTAETLAIIGTVATGALVGAPVTPLYARIEKPDALAAEPRRRVYAHVAATPGITASEIAAREGIDRKTAVHHARVLHRHRLLEAVRDGRATRYYLPGASRGRPLVHGTAAKLLRLALDHPDISQTRAAARLDVCRATVQWHARSLEARRLLEPGRLRVPPAQAEGLRRSLPPVRGWPDT